MKQKWILFAAVFFAAQSLVACGTSTHEVSAFSSTGNSLTDQLAANYGITFRNSSGNLIISTSTGNTVANHVQYELTASQRSGLQSLCAQFIAANQSSTDSYVMQEVDEMSFIQSLT